MMATLSDNKTRLSVSCIIVKVLPFIAFTL